MQVPEGTDPGDGDPLHGHRGFGRLTAGEEMRCPEMGKKVPSGNVTMLKKNRMFNWKTHDKLQCSMAMLNYQRVAGCFFPSPP